MRRCEEEIDSVVMGCSSSKSHKSAAMRMLEYEYLAETENSGLTTIPSQLDSEEWRDGLIRHWVLLPFFIS